MIKFKAEIKKFAKKGEKSGWSYVEISSTQANKIKPDTKKSFRVKGMIDYQAISSLALFPMGNGAFILPLKTELRKKLGKDTGDKVELQLEVDTKVYQMNKELMLCLKEEPEANSKFNKQPLSYRKYYSKWVDTAKTTETKARRIGAIMNGMVGGLTFPEIMKLSSSLKK